MILELVGKLPISGITEYTSSILDELIIFDNIISFKTTFLVLAILVLN